MYWSLFFLIVKSTSSLNYFEISIFGWQTPKKISKAPLAPIYTSFDGRARAEKTNFWPAFSKFCPRSRKIGKNWVFLVVWKSSTKKGRQNFRIVFFLNPTPSPHPRENPRSAPENSVLHNFFANMKKGAFWPSHLLLLFWLKSSLIFVACAQFYPKFTYGAKIFPCKAIITSKNKGFLYIFNFFTQAKACVIFRIHVSSLLKRSSLWSTFVLSWIISV